MLKAARPTDTQEVRKRAAKIRGAWSTSERRLRTGLPPDAPTKIRDYILALRTVAWATESPASR